MCFIKNCDKRTLADSEYPLLHVLNFIVVEFVVVEKNAFELDKINIAKTVLIASLCSTEILKIKLVQKQSAVKSDFYYTR
jgi:hypothetical protein